MVTGAEQLTAAIDRLRLLNMHALSVNVEIVCAAAEIVLFLMDSPARVEWCDYHGRPHEFCQVVDAGSCVPRVRAVGPEVAIWTT